jgi:hypothetical protein
LKSLPPCRWLGDLSAVREFFKKGGRKSAG